jgi:asparagine synthase (glutamine-hydrolysing)
VPGIFGYFDPLRTVSTATLEKMARTFYSVGIGTITSERFGFGGFGIHHYKDSEGISGESQPVRYAVLGRLDPSEDCADTPSQRDIAKQYFSSGKVGSLLSARGSFSAVMVDTRNESVTLLSDHFGSQPLYVWWNGKTCFFASQLKAILAAIPGKPVIDQASVATMLSYGEVIGNRTLVSGIETLPAATYLRLTRDRVECQKYWQYVYEEDRSSRWDDSVDRSGNALLRSVGRCVKGSETVAVPLSGGLDSRFVLDIACQHGKQATAYTWGIEGCRDLLYASETAKRLSCPHESFLYQPDYLSRVAELGVWLTEGHTPATNFHVLPFVRNISAASHDCLLDGFAGDVVLGGNFISDAWLQEGDGRAAVAAIWQWRRSGFDNKWSCPELSHFREHAETLFVESFESYPGLTPMDKAMAFLIDNRLRRTTACGSELFRSRLPVWQPFMDVDFQNVIRTLPHHWRKRHRFYLAVLNKFAPVSAGAPYQRTMLPASSPYWGHWISLALQRSGVELFSRMALGNPFPRRSPSNFSSWLRSHLRKYVESMLLSERSLDRGIIPPDAIRSVVNEHMSNARDLTALVGAMLSLEIFFQLFVDDIQASLLSFESHYQRISSARE